jgi:hypothetical protein
MQLYRQPKKGVEDGMYIIPEAGGACSICRSTVSQKVEEESMYPYILYLRLEGPIWSCIGSQKGVEESVEDSMYQIPEA